MAAGLRLGDLLSTSPTTLVLIKDGRIGFAAKTKPGESLKVDIGGLAILHFLTKIG